MLTGVRLGSLDLMNIDEAGVRWDIDSLEGWGSPASTLAVEQRIRSHGGWAGDAFLGPRPLTISGTCDAPSVGVDSDAMDRLIAATALDETTLSVAEDGRNRIMTVRRDGPVMTTWTVDQYRHFDWSIQLIALDPRKFTDPLSATTGLPSTTGGLTVPFTVPFTISSTVVTGQVSLTNPGNITGPVRLRIDGPITAPVITHVSSGKVLIFASSLVLGVDEFVVVDMERQEVLAQGQEPRNAWVIKREWSGFEPGANTWAFAAAGDGPGMLTVEAQPAWQ